MIWSDLNWNGHDIQEIIGMDQTPTYWGVHALGYTHRVYTGYHTHDRTPMFDWLSTQLGSMDKAPWIDQSDCVCFVHESDALMFEIVWCTTWHIIKHTIHCVWYLYQTHPVMNIGYGLWTTFPNLNLETLLNSWKPHMHQSLPLGLTLGGLSFQIQIPNHCLKSHGYDLMSI